MGSIQIYKGMPPLTNEQKQRLDTLAKMSDDEIDYSYIPPLTDEELARMKPARFRQRKSQNIAS